MGEGPAVLVTGAAGYVGRLCVAALAKRLGELSALVALDWTEIDPSERGTNPCLSCAPGTFAQLTLPLLHGRGPVSQLTGDRS